MIVDTTSSPTSADRLAGESACTTKTRGTDAFVCQSRDPRDSFTNTGRREFGKLALGGVLGRALGAELLADAAQAATHTIQPGIKLCAQTSAKPSDDDLLYLQQIGAEYVSIASTPDLRTAEGFLQIKKRYADAGVTVWNIGKIGRAHV